MDEREIREKLVGWMINFVEKPNSLLNDWPPCPYARQARVNDKIEILFKPDQVEVETFIIDNLYKLNNLDVIIFCLDHTKINGQELSNKIERLNESFMSKDVVLLEDHPDTIEQLNGVVMSFGLCALVFAQSLTKLNEASDQLKQKGYYDHWPQYNLDYVLNWRNK